MRHPLAAHLHRIQMPGRYLGGEINSVQRETARDTVLFALVYPELYEIGMSNLGMKILYHVLNGIEGVYCERAFLPAPDAEEIMAGEGIPLFSLETYRPLGEFDAVGFSVHTELNYTNILHALRLADIPLRADERDERHPIVIIGGPASFNPEPLKAFADAFVVGEGEDVVAEIVEVLRARKSGDLDRDGALLELSKIEGVFVPRYPAPRVSRRWVQFSPDAFPTAQVVPNVRIVHDRFSIEIMRGCTRGCRFCEGGMVYRPIRIREVEEVVSLTKRGIAETGFEDISLLAFTVSDYPDLTALLFELKKELGGETYISVPSLPVNAVTEELFRQFKEMRRFSITLAPETVSEELRARINKNVPLEEIMSSVETAEKYGFRRIKLYFMVGLPGETPDDVARIADLMEDLTRSSRKTRFKLSLNPFVPRPHTPFQWERQFSVKEIYERVGLLKDRLKRLRRVEFSWHDPKKAFLEGVLGRGDEKLSEVTLRAYELGARFDDRSEFFNFRVWLRAFDETGVDPDEYLSERDPAKPLPWNYIDVGVTERYLLRELRNSRVPRFTSDCMREGCTGCGPWYREGYTLCRTGYRPSREPDSLLISEPRKENVFYRYVLVYSKTKPAAFLSELNTMAAFVRALRRAGVRLRYSEGYVPHPKMSFSPSLYLGAESEAEILYLETLEKYDPEELKNGLNSQLPKGIHVSCAKEATSKPVWEELDSALYSVDLADFEIDEEKIEKTVMTGEVLRKGKVFRLRDHVISWRYDGKKLLLKLKLRGGPGLTRFLSGFLGIDPEEARGVPVRRLAFYRGDEPFRPC
ncbi:MAG: DUF2344 domain-containing protein [Candidatus Hydrothermae bacterium]|nr:DUF2344 domain-containing protein [Candidatus Hydrothermae bacterium]